MAFLNPIFLLGAIAAAVPVLVHLVRRTRARREPFPSLMFLRRIEQKTIRRRTIRNWLLLALRCLALLLLALAFARPFFPSLSAKARTEEGGSSIILIDVSYSMGYGDEMARAKRAAAAIVDDAGVNEQIAVAAFGQSFEVLSPLGRDHQAALGALSSVQAGLESTDYEQAIAGANSLLSDTHSGQKHIHLVSDFQAAGWDRTRPSTKLSPGVQLVAADVADDNSSNLAVLDVKADSLIHSQKYAGKVSAEIANFSLKSADVPVEFRLNDLAVERRQMSIEPQSSETIEFTGFNVPAGSNRATIEITGDDFALDNRYYFTIRREDQQRVLVIETASRGRSESFFLQQALAAGGNDEQALTVKTPGTLNPADVDTYQVVIVNDVAGLGVGLAQALKGFVTRGGGLVIAAARHSDPSEFNKLFAGVAPAQLGDTIPARGYSLMSQIRTDHPLFAPFARSGRIASPRVYAHRSCTANEGATTVAALDDGSPMIVEGAAGKGRVVLICTSLDTAWSDLPLTPIYLPLIRQMLGYTRGAGQTLGCIVGQAFRALADADGTHPAVEAPGGGRVEDSSGSVGTDAQIVQSQETGFYRLRYRDRSDYVASNLDTRESDFSRLNAQELVASFLSDGARSTGESSGQPTLTDEQIETRQRVWLPLLLVALTLFLAEAVVARRVRVPRLMHE